VNVDTEPQPGISRGQFLVGAGAASLGVLLAACSGEDEAVAPPPAGSELGGAETKATPPPTGEAPLKKGLAEGMYGGPVGWPGAERYQYPLDSEEGRAIAALRRLHQDGKAPDELLVQVFNFARPQFDQAFPEGALSLVALFEEETGIRIDFVETDPGSEYQQNLRNASTRNGSFDVVTTFIEELGDFAEAGLLLPLDDFVAKYRPSWADPTYGYAGGEPTVTLFTKYKGSTYAVAFDNDTQPYFYRSDLLESPVEAAAFEDKYGRPLEFPLTWDDHDQVAEFFTRPDQELYGDVNTLAPFWCAVKWSERFVCSANPNLVYFNDDGSANVNNEAGVCAFAELLKSLDYNEPGALKGSFFSQYELMGGGNGFMGGSFPNQTMLVPGNPELDTGHVGRYIKTDVTPGRVGEGSLVRRPGISFNISFSANAFADPSHREAAYLFLQWAGGARVHTWLTVTPGTAFDPCHLYSLDDPYVAAGYKPQPTGQLKNIIPRTAPPITLKGGNAYRDALSEELQKVLTRRQTPERAAKALEDRWNRITEEQGVETQVEALKTFNQGFPRITDPPGRQLPVEEVSTVVS